jgi:enoyl-CoA hydratase/carnithine racemase
LSSTDVITERGDGWTLVTLTSHAGLNRLGSDTLVPLLEEVRKALAEGCRCLGLTGKGDSFAVGADLNQIAGLTPEAARRFSDLGNSIFRLLESTDAIVVAGIDGFCLGGGLDLALAADWRIASSRSAFGHPGADIGLITGFGGTQRLPRLIGPRKAAQWFYSAARVSALDAYEAGLLQEVVPDDDFEESFMGRILAFTAQSPERAREMKYRFRHYGFPDAVQETAGANGPA